MTLSDSTLATFMRQYLECDPVRSGRAYVRLKGYGVHVWAIVGALQAEAWNVEQVAQEYAVPEDAVMAAMAFYYRYPEYIDAFLLLNGDEWDGADLTEKEG